MGKRIYNFNPGPATLPLKVLEQVQAEMLDFKGTGMSITEISHRAPAFDEVHNSAIARTKRLLDLTDDFEVIFVQGGASLQFAMIPMNLCGGKRPAFVNTGTWSTKAIQEAEIQGKNPNVLASSEEANFSYIPKEFEAPGDAAYLYFCSNNTIKGTQWQTYPTPPAGVPLISDMCSDILSRPFDAKPFGLFFAGAQKNVGPAGLAVVIIRKDMLERIPEGIPTMLNYGTYVKKNSLFNTPPCFSIYVTELVLKWLEDDIGGLAKMEAINQEKAGIVYGALDNSGGFYKPTAAKEDRSLMNATFRIVDPELEPKFVAEGLENGLGGLKGHKSVGGCRASLYNAMPMEGAKALADFMATFAKKYG